MLPWGGWILWPHRDPYPTITLTLMWPPTPKFNPNTDAQPRPAPFNLPGGASEAHLLWDAAFEQKKKDDEIWLPDEIHSVSQWSATVRQAWILSRWSKAPLTLQAPPRTRPVPESLWCMVVRGFMENVSHVAAFFATPSTSPASIWMRHNFLGKVRIWE